MGQALLALLAALCIAAVAVASPWGSNPVQSSPSRFFVPQDQAFDLALDLAGDAVEAEHGRAFVLTLALQGLVVRSHAPDPSAPTEAGELLAQVQLVAADNGAVVGVWQGRMAWAAGKDQGPLGLDGWGFTLTSLDSDLDMTLRGRLGNAVGQDRLTVSFADAAGSAALRLDGEQALPFALSGAGQARSQRVA
jgi:hypothetical protein